MIGGGGLKNKMLDTVLRLGIVFVLDLIAFMILGWFVSFGGTLNVDFVPYVDICLGRGC